MLIFFQDLSLLESDESINYLSFFFLSFRGRKQHIYLSSYQSSLPLCQKRHKHRERMSRRKDELMAMERSASLHLSAGRWRKRPSWEGVNISPDEVAGNSAACHVSGDPGQPSIELMVRCYILPLGTILAPSQRKTCLSTFAIRHLKDSSS